MSEESMNSEERVKLIKWGCKYAENYRITATYPIGKVIVVNPSKEWLLIQDFPNHYLYRDFLQQTILGAILHFDLKQTIFHNGFWIKFVKNPEKEEWFEFGENITDAYESALKYIMDQEGVE